MTELADRGRQAERTVLAYWRTELAVTVVAMLMVREAAPGAERLAVAIIAGAAVGVAAATSFRRQRRLVAGRTAADPVAVLGLAASVTALQLVALAIVL